MHILIGELIRGDLVPVRNVIRMDDGLEDGEALLVIQGAVEIVRVNSRYFLKQACIKS